AKDQSEALMTYVQVLGRPNVHSRFVKVPGLAPDRSYRIEGEEKVYSGDTLANVGILIQGLWGDFQSKLIHIVEV
ncbi:MAG: GH36 C-terminal domain-containing protein, partial [Lachnospiraceae bacterium]|nr:GH36 C-terminal domain-containing protein [Lachnospiraceae bacterium]